MEYVKESEGSRVSGRCCGRRGEVMRRSCHIYKDLERKFPSLGYDGKAAMEDHKTTGS